MKNVHSNFQLPGIHDQAWNYVCQEFNLEVLTPNSFVIVASNLTVRSDWSLSPSISHARALAGRLCSR